MTELTDEEIARIAIDDAEMRRHREAIVERWLIERAEHKPCRGLGFTQVGQTVDGTSAQVTIDCPGPHVMVEIIDESTYRLATHLEPSEIDGFLLYADGFIIYTIQALLRGSLPEGWTIKGQLRDEDDPLQAQAHREREETG